MNVNEMLNPVEGSSSQAGPSNAAFESTNSPTEAPKDIKFQGSSITQWPLLLQIIAKFLHHLDIRRAVGLSQNWSWSDLAKATTKEYGLRCSEQECFNVVKREWNRLERADEPRSVNELIPPRMCLPPDWLKITEHLKKRKPNRWFLFETAFVTLLYQKTNSYKEIETQMELTAAKHNWFKSTDDFVRLVPTWTSGAHRSASSIRNFVASKSMTPERKQSIQDYSKMLDLAYTVIGGEK